VIVTDSGSCHHEISNNDISGTGRPIDFMFDSSVGFSGTADRIDLPLIGQNPRQWQLASWKFEITIFVEFSSDHLRAYSRGAYCQQWTNHIACQLIVPN